MRGRGAGVGVRCGHTEFDEDGDCENCREPDVVDWVRYGHEWYENGQYEEAQAGLPFEYSTLTADKSVAQAFSDLCRRRHNLSWSNHQTVQAFPEDEQDEWLDKAEVFTSGRQIRPPSSSLGHPG